MKLTYSEQTLETQGCSKRRVEMQTLTTQNFSLMLTHQSPEKSEQRERKQSQNVTVGSKKSEPTNNQPVLL